MQENRTYLVTGGTGTVGQALVFALLQNPTTKQVLIYSRDEYKQYLLRQNLEANYQSKVRFVIGDIKDLNRLNETMSGVSHVIHTAALKHVPYGEEFPQEFIQTNILGTANVINAALNHNVEKFIVLSTSKAVAPINLYGATKLCADKLALQANQRGRTKFTVLRCGNIFEARGSVVPLFLAQKKSNRLTITDPKMSRFSISVQQVVAATQYCVDYAVGGELIIPKCPSYFVGDLAKAIAPDAEHAIIGLREGEKLHEEIILKSDVKNTYENDDYFFTLSSFLKEELGSYISKLGLRRVPADFYYSSEYNTKILTISELQRLLSIFDPLYDQK